MKKIFIAGCGGMLGQSFYNEFKENYEVFCTDIDVNEDWLNFQDFRDYDSYQKLVKQQSPDILIHLGAHTDLEYCELNIDDAYRTNTLSVQNATYIANQLSIPLIYISTAGIFDGSKDSFDDWDAPNPIGVYARTKYLGEKIVVENANNYFIFRAGWMMGGHEKDKKFIYKIINQIKSGVSVLNIVNDRDGTPTYTVDFARNVKKVIESEFYGLYNLVCPGLTSRLEVTQEILKVLDLDKSIRINEVSSDFFKKQYFAERPTSERLLNKKLDLMGLNLMRDWKEALKHYLGSLKI